MMVNMISTSDALIAVSDSILNSIDELNKLEYNKKGRKYRFVNNNFQRIREEDKHLIIYPENLEMKASVISSYYILANIDNGEILKKFPDFCLSIIGVANELELNTWYEEENSSVIHFKNAKYNPLVVEEEALNYFKKVNETHIKMGLNLMVCSKLNFLHTDHHIGTKLEGHYMKYFINEYFGSDALNSSEVLIALKSFVHWGNIKGILYKLDIPNINLSPELKASYDKFPDPLPELKLSVYDRYPSGASKYSLIRKSVDILGDWKYSKLVPYPKGGQYGLDWLYELCHNIEKNPIRYHLRSSTKNLCNDSINLTELSNLYSKNIKSLLNLISLIINIFKNTGGEFLLQNSKIPKFDDNLIKNNLDYYNQLVKLNEAIENYESKNWDSDDIILRLNNDTLNSNSMFEKVMQIREKYIDDYE